MEKELRDNISRIRQEKKISQKEMAEKLGISRASYISMEKGKTRLLNENVEKFAALNNVSPSELVLGYRISEDVHTLQEAQADYGRKRQEIIDAYEERIAKLNQEIEGLNQQISDLRDSIDTKKDVIAMLRGRLRDHGLSDV
jgi:transcriptional regulator with XRE-family HTH domain